MSETHPLPPDPLEPELDGKDERPMKTLSRRGLIWSVVYIAGIFGGLRWLNKSPLADGANARLRKALEFNEGVWGRLYTKKSLSPEYPRSRVTPERLNETIGMDDDLDVDAWRLVVEGTHGRDKPLELTFKQILAMPSHEMTTEFFCIEGWSVVQTWKGVLMSEFLKAYPPKTLSGGKPDLNNGAHELVPYAAMTTPNGDYYTGLDMASVLHPQTMLCYEMNGKPLTDEHGAPLRLVIPVKYGIKNIKRLGRITFTSERPKDYWGEQGYDWYAAL